MSQPRQELPVLLRIVHVKRHKLLNGLEVHKLHCLHVKELPKLVPESLLELVRLGSRTHELNLRVDPLDDNVDTLTVKFLRASEFEIGQALLKAFTHVHILELFLDQVVCVGDQVKGYLEVASFDQLIQH